MTFQSGGDDTFVKVLGVENTSKVQLVGRGSDWQTKPMV